MAVIALPNYEPQGAQFTDEWELRSITAKFSSPLSGAAHTLERPGAVWAVTLYYHGLVGARRAKMQAFLSACRGHGSRFYVPTYFALRGAFAAPELMGSLSSTSGWTTAGNGAPALTSEDESLRSTLTANAVSSTDMIRNQAAVSSTQHAPYSFRVIAGLGRFGATLVARIRDGSSTALFTGTASAAPALYRVTGVPSVTSLIAALNSGGAGTMAGDHLLLRFASLARCAMVDNGPNFHQYSDAIDNAYWSKVECSANADAVAAPDGTTTAESLIENSATSQHYFSRGSTRTSQAEDWCVYGYFRRAVGSRNLGLVIGRDGSNYSRVFFDLDAGTVGTPSNIGDNTLARAFIAPAGGGWYYCALVARLAASTGLLTQCDIVSGASTVNYAGDGASGIAAWRVGAAQASVPTRGMQTTSAGDSDGLAQTGAGLDLRGLPVSTSGLLLAGDCVEVVTPTGSEMKRVTAALNSNAAGHGFLRFEPPLRESPADGAAVIVQNPLVRMLLDSNSVRWREHSGGFCDLEFTAVEDIVP